MGNVLQVSIYIRPAVSNYDYNISILVTTQYCDVSWAGKKKWGVILKRLQNEEEISLKTHLHLSALPSSLMETLEGQIFDHRNNEIHSQK